ncbi:MAG: sulfoxide reductase heme-binding subunit YedZ [Acidovorax sp.]|nr:sulfoxide reductase heme-binding subunit YedZ [Acidovorax sp.]
MAGASSRATPWPWLLRAWVKPLVFVACLAPLAWLVVAAASNALGANPAEALIRSLGEWALRFLCLALAVTPLRQLTGQPALARLRRMVGLWAFAYALLHLLAYAWLDRGLEWSELLADIAQRPFILVGTLAWGLLLLLALTSFDAAVRWLGGKRWRALHRAVYLVAPLALLHFYWMRAGKRNWLEVGVYALVLGLLLGWRAYSAWRARRRG